MAPGAEGKTTREEALVKTRARAAEQRAELERLGATFDIDPEEALVEWDIKWGIPFGLLWPVPPKLLRAAVARLNELDASLDASLVALEPSEWDLRDGPEGWSVRMVVDHLAQGYILFMQRLERWPLDPDEAQAGAVDELIARVTARAGQPGATELFGWNLENRRVRWTSRKVLRVVAGLQQAWLEHSAGGPRPAIAIGHEDVAGDDEPVDDAQVATVRAQDAELRTIARENPRVRQIAFWYRYYRDRLVPWPVDELERWRATRAVFRERLLAMDERDLARIQLPPDGACTSVRQQLGVALAHIQEHAAQIAQIRSVVTVPARI